MLENYDVDLLRELFGEFDTSILDLFEIFCENVECRRFSIKDSVLEFRKQYYYRAIFNLIIVLENFDSSEDDRVALIELLFRFLNEYYSVNFHLRSNKKIRDVAKL